MSVDGPDDDRIPVRNLGKDGVWLLSREGRDAVPGPATVPTHGFGLPQGGGGFNAVFALDDEIWLQVCERRWRATDIRRIDWVDEGLRFTRYRLTLRDGTQEEAVIRFRLSQIVTRLVDPTYDEMASWNDDVMKLLPYSNGDWPRGGAREVAEWAADIAPRWSQGVPPDL